MFFHGAFYLISVTITVLHQLNTVIEHVTAVLVGESKDPLVMGLARLSATVFVIMTYHIYENLTKSVQV